MTTTVTTRARLTTLAWVCLLLTGAPATIAGAGEMRTYGSKYYVVHSDLDPAVVREASLRMTYMAEEYYNRTRALAVGQINRKFRFMLFSRREDYRAAGGPDGSIGVFLGSDPAHPLAALRIEERPEVLWHTIQHEGFHQFSCEVLRGGGGSGGVQPPAWLEEGLAEYFGHAEFTGESLVPGVIPPDRLAMVQRMIPSGRFRDINRLTAMTNATWVGAADGADYLHVWFLVHYLVHAENGKLLPPFEQYIKASMRPATREPVLLRAYLGPPEELERRWREWWLEQRPDATRDLYARAAVTGLCAYLGRAAAQKQSYDTVQALMTALDGKQVNLPEADWLPPSLPESIRKWMAIGGDDIRFEIGADRSAPPQAIATLADGTRLVATYNPRATDHRVTVEADAMPVELARATALLGESKPAEARKVIQEAITKYPKSPQLEAARRVLQQTYATAPATAKPPVRTAAATPAEATTRPVSTGRAASRPAGPARLPELPSILIISARYGAGDRWVDVTDSCRRLVKGDVLTLPGRLSNAFEVDPYPRVTKCVDAIVMLNGVAVRVVLSENAEAESLRISAKGKG